MVEKNKTVVLLVSTMVLIILGVALLTSISDTTLLNTQKTGVTDEQVLLTAATACPGGTINTTYTHTLTNAPTGWKAQDSDCYVSGFVLTNSSGTAFTTTTDYVLDPATGTFTLKNTALVNQTCVSNNITLADYAYCGDSYMADGWVRTVLNTNVGLFAIVILLVGVAAVYLLFGKEKYE